MSFQTITCTRKTDCELGNEFIIFNNKRKLNTGGLPQARWNLLCNVVRSSKDPKSVPDQGQRASEVARPGPRILFFEILVKNLRKNRFFWLDLVRLRFEFWLII